MGVRLLEQEKGRDGDEAPICLGGRGAAPPEHCGSPTGYRLILKRQKQGEVMCIPVRMDAVMGMLSASDPNEPASTWQKLRQALHDGFQSIDRRLKEYGRFGARALQPARS